MQFAHYFRTKTIENKQVMVLIIFEQKKMEDGAKPKMHLIKQFF